MEITEVAAGIIEKDNRFLIALRKQGKHLEGFWEFPGGKIEKNETPEECLIRELKEEFNITVRVKEYVGESKFQYSSIVISLRGFIGELSSGEFELIDHDEIQWVDFISVKKFKLAPADIPLLQLYQVLNKSVKL